MQSFKLGLLAGKVSKKPKFQKIDFFILEIRKFHFFLRKSEMAFFGQ